jgi:hypothetical protein
LYEWQPGGPIRMFIVLAIAPQFDEFIIEVAWSLKGRFPGFLHPMCPVAVPEHGIMEADAPVDGEFRFRLSRLWEPGKSIWWRLKAQPDATDQILEDLIPGTIAEIQEGARPVEEAVAHTIGAVEKYAIPYFEGVRKRHGQGG